MDIRTSPRRWWALFSLVPAVLAVGLDATVLSVALPTLGHELDATTGELQWFLVAYTLAFAAAMIPAGNLGDRIGRKRVLLGALVVFGLASVACALALGAGSFIAARVLLGVGAAAILPMALAALPFLFDEQERGRAVGLIMTVTMLGFPLGPVLGGWLLSHAWWGWVFLINVPVVAIGLVAIGMLMPESPRSTPACVDGLGIGLSAGALAVLSYGLIEAGDRGWTDPRSLLLLVVGLVLVAVFIAWERRTTEPLVDLRLFSSREFSSASAVAALLSFVMMGLLFALPLHAQAVHGLGAQATGLRLLPLIGGMLLTAMPSGVVAARVGARLVVTTGMLVLAGGLAWGASIGLGDNTWDSAGWTLVCGAGLGMTLPTAMDAALGTLSEAASGTGSAVLQALRMVGSSFGAAALGSVLNARYRSELDDAGVLTGLPPAAAGAAHDSVVQAVALADRLGLTPLLDAARSAYVSGMSQMLWAGFAVSILGAAVSVLTMAGRRTDARRDEAGSVHEPDSVA
jgi:DHA2 family multidrug resistance protein-like MFS transporter